MAGRSRYLQQKPEEKIDTDVDTDALDSDDHDFFSRKRNFDIISKKFNKHLMEKYHLYRANDLQYNNYLRKMEKLASQMSLDFSGFKDYLFEMNKLQDKKFEEAKKLASNYLKELQEREIRKEELKKFTDKQAPEAFINSSLNETKIILDALDKSLNAEMRKIFDVTNEETFQNKDFEDLRFLRLARFLKKVRTNMISASIMEHLQSQESTKAEFDELYQKIDKEIELEDVAAHKEDYFTSVLCSKPAEYHDQLFGSLGRYVANSETIRKYKNVLINPEIMEKLKDDNLKGTRISSEAYLVYNDVVIEQLIQNSMTVLSKKYHVRDLYKKKLNLEEIEKKDIERIKRKEELIKKHNLLRDRLFNELLYDEKPEEDEGVKSITSKENEPVNIAEDKENLANTEKPNVVDVEAGSTSKRTTPDKRIKFIERHKLKLQEKQAEKEKSDFIDYDIDDSVKFELIWPDKKPTNKKMSEMDIEEEKRKKAFLEEEIQLREYYKNYNPSDKLHSYFSKTLEENKDLIKDKREREEIDKFLHQNPPVREYYDNLAAYYEEYDRVHYKFNPKYEERIEEQGEDVDYSLDFEGEFKEFLESLPGKQNTIDDIIVKEINDYEFFKKKEEMLMNGLNPTNQEVEQAIQNDRIRKLKEDRRKNPLPEGQTKTYYDYVTERGYQNTYYDPPVHFYSEKLELDENLSVLTKVKFNSEEFNQALNTAIKEFESKKDYYQYIESQVDNKEYLEEVTENADYWQKRGEIKAEIERREHLSKITSTKMFKMERVMEDKPFPWQKNRRSKRRRAFLTNKLVIAVPPPRRTKDDPIRLKEKRKPRDIEKENKRLFGNIARQNAKNRELQPERAKQMRERFIQYFGNYRAMMYPDGFRHLENYNVYKQCFPDKTLADYQLEIHSICDFETFHQIILGHFEQMKKLGIMAMEFEEMRGFLSCYVTFLKSKHSAFMPILKESYRSILREFQAHDRTFTLLEAIEQVCQYNFQLMKAPQIKSFFPDQESATVMNLDQAYIPTRNQAVPFPDLKGDQGDSSGLIRTSPFFPINPLKGHPIRQDATFQHRPTPFAKNKVLFHKKKLKVGIKGRSFHCFGGIPSILTENWRPEIFHKRNPYWRFSNPDLKI